MVGSEAFSLKNPQSTVENLKQLRLTSCGLPNTTIKI